MTCWSEFWPKLLYYLMNTNLLIKSTKDAVVYVFVIYEKFPSFRRSVTGELLKPFRT